MIDNVLIFVKLAELKSYTATAKHFQSTKSTISRKIDLLELYFNKSLILRTSKSFSLTEEGKFLYRKFQTLPQQMEDAYNSLNKINSFSYLKTLKPLIGDRSNDHLFLKSLVQFAGYRRRSTTFAMPSTSMNRPFKTVQNNRQVNLCEVNLNNLSLSACAMYAATSRTSWRRRYDLSSGWLTRVSRTPAIYPTMSPPAKATKHDPGSRSR